MCWEGAKEAVLRNVSERGPQEEEGQVQRRLVIPEMGAWARFALVGCIFMDGFWMGFGHPAPIDLFGVLGPNGTIPIVPVFLVALDIRLLTLKGLVGRLDVLCL